ncbi:MAG: hypothetical protein SFV19_06740 [Rhodospirillaceae bacterium]|nr:hypothetical protein [Rhodospirillaceae bacterium]
MTVKSIALACAVMLGLCGAPALFAPAVAAPEGKADAKLQADIEAVIHDMAGRWASDTWQSIPTDLWDANEPMPMYLAEEQAGWLMGWE